MQLLPGLAKVQCPVLVMAGELDPVTPLEDAQDIAAAIPAPWGRLAVFDRAGHGGAGIERRARGGTGHRSRRFGRMVRQGTRARLRSRGKNG